MSDRTRVEWADASWNPIVGCTPVSAGCEHCYAARMAKRLAGRCGYPMDWSKPTLRESALDQPLRWKRPRRIFACSMGDPFHPGVDRWNRVDVFQIMRGAYWHTFMVLTKRPEYIPADLNFPPNVWCGVTAENQEMADQRIPELLKVKASVRFVSCEPLLGPLDFRKVPGLNLCGQAGIDLLKNFWVIVGGETGPGARPMHPDWVRSIRDQCQRAGVKFFFKGWGEWAPWDDDNWSLPSGSDDVEAHDGAIWFGGDGVKRTSQLASINWGAIPDDSYEMLCVGKRRSGRLLDGREWSEIPGVTQ